MGIATSIYFLIMEGKVRGVWSRACAPDSAGEGKRGGDFQAQANQRSGRPQVCHAISCLWESH
jgi:hypothetical protein